MTWLSLLYVVLGAAGAGLFVWSTYYDRRRANNRRTFAVLVATTAASIVAAFVGCTEVMVAVSHVAIPGWRLAGMLYVFVVGAVFVLAFISGYAGGDATKDAGDAGNGA